MSHDPRHATATGQSAADPAARYETLRAYAAQPHAPATRDGLVVLLRQGVAAWMNAGSRLPAPLTRPPQEESQRPSPWPEDACAEVVHVLAAMTLKHIQEVRA